jgi:hypothetical protein
MVDLILWPPIAFVALFSLRYIGRLHAPVPHHVPIGVVGTLNRNQSARRPARGFVKQRSTGEVMGEWRGVASTCRGALVLWYDASRLSRGTGCGS